MWSSKGVARFEFLSQDAHGVEVVEGAVLGEASAEDAFGPEPGAHVGGDCPAVVAPDLKAYALDVKRIECVGEDGMHSVAAEAAACHSQEDAQFGSPSAVGQIAEGDATDECGSVAPGNCPHERGRVRAVGGEPCTLVCHGEGRLSAHVTERIRVVVPGKECG